MGGSGAETQSTAQSSNQQQNYSQSPAEWVNQLSQQVGNTGIAGYNQSNNIANQMQGNAANMVNTGNQMTNNAGNMMGGAYNQAQTASQYNPETFQQNFMNPYTQDVVQQNADIAQRNFNQQTAPSLMGQYGASGQFGSGRATQGMALAQAQNQQNVNQMNAGLMNQGYHQSQQNYLNSMGIGVQGAGAMAGAGSGLGQVGNTAYNQGMGQLLAPGQVFGTYGSGLKNLPYGMQGSSTTATDTAGTNNAPQQSLL